MRIVGLTHFWSETGSEGGHPVIEDIRSFEIPNNGLHPDTNYFCIGSYNGKVSIETGDSLTIYSDTTLDKVLYQNNSVRIEFNDFDKPKSEWEMALYVNRWLTDMNAIQINDLFLEPHPAVLIKNNKDFVSYYGEANKRFDKQYFRKIERYLQKRAEFHNLK